MTTNARPFRDLALALSGPIVWAAHFFVVYGLEATVCTRAASPILTMQLIVSCATAVAIVVLAVFTLHRLRVPPSENDALFFLNRISIFLALISIGAVLAVAVSATQLSACLQLAG